MKDLHPAAAIGAVSGLRAFTAPAAVSRAASRGLLDMETPALEWMKSPLTSKILLGLAVAELVSDKLPFTPSRLQPGSLAARLVSGALCGAAVNAARKRPVVVGALVGATAALGAAFAGYHARQALTAHGDLPDMVVALVEDGVAVVTAMSASSLLRPATDGSVLPDLR